MFIILFISLHISFIYSKDKPTQEDHSYISIKNVSSPIHPKKIQVTFSEENRPPPKHESKHVNNNTTLNLKTYPYLIDILASPDVSKWFTKVRPIIETIKHFGLTKNH